MTLGHHEILPSLKIEKIVYKGLGLGFYKNSPIFVYQGIPGDDLKVRLVHKRGDVYFGEIVSYNKRSDLHIPVRCEAFKDCGGCDWLHLNYEDQLRFKQQIFNEFFEQYGNKEAIIQDIEPSPKIDYYRNKIFLPVSSTNDGLIAGMYARRSHTVIPHQRCYLQPEDSDRIVELCLKLLNKAHVSAYNEKTNKGTIRYIGLRYSEANDKYLVILVTNTRKLPFFNTIVKGLVTEFPEIIGVVQNINEGKTNRLLGEETKSLYGSEYLEEKVGEITFRTHYSSFFQVNTGQTANILEFIKQELSSDDIVVDAYSGIGTIGVYIADRVEKVICLEEHSLSVKDGIENAQMNNVANCKFYKSKVEKEIKRLLEKSSANAIVLDPPRKGVDKKVIDAITDSRVEKIIYLSCDIATQKRDLELLLKGGFKVNKIKPFDMFPHTYHIENAVIMTRSL